MAHKSRSVDLEPAQRASSLPIRLGVLASEQWGVVTHGQLLALGFSSSAIQRACATGRLHRRHRGVYAVGHTAIRREGHWLAAVLACGAGAALSHRSAAVLWDLRPSWHRVIEVTAALRGRVSPHGVRLHGTARLAPSEVTVRSGVPVTTVSRTLADLAAVLGHRDLERTFERAEALQVLDVPSVIASVQCRPGAPAVRRILDAWEPTATRSELEVALLRLIGPAGLPRPEVNARVGEFEVDLLWRKSKLVAEADSIAFHLTRAAMERDRRRDAVLARDGYRVLRFTDRQVRRRPIEVTTAIRAALHGSVPLEPAQRA
jgi:hypothetical protein